MKYSGIYFVFLFIGVISALFTCPVIATDIAEQGVNQAAKVSIDTLSNGTSWNDYNILSYNGSITGASDTLEWDFGDSTSASGTSGSHTYSIAGTYTITLSAQSNSSATDTETITITEPELVASMEYKWDGKTNKLTYNSTTTGATSWSWDFDDSSTDSTTENGIHTYTQPDEYVITLTAKSPAGKTSSCTETIDLRKVMAYFEPDKTSGSSPLTVKFEDDSTRNPKTKDDILEWVWDFDDGSSDVIIKKGSDPDVEHTFTKEEEYEVKLTVDDGEDTDSYYVLIKVDDDSAPTADFELYSDDYDDEGKAPHIVKFKDISKPSKKTNSTIDEWDWEFINEDGKTVYDSYSQNPPSYTFNQPGKYTIKLTVTDKDGASDTEIKEDFIEVTLGLSATFSAITTSGYKPLTVAFTASPGSDNDYAISKYYWEFGDGYTDSTTSKTASHTYTIAGTYTPKLTVTDTKGYTYTYKKDNYITVKDISQITAATTQATAAPTESLTELTDNSNGEKIFGLPGTEYFRDEMERFYSFYEEYLSLFAGIFGMK
ncbi:PKD domain-containing protein [Methanoeremita antiquus]|uniref:PKD domain-containing protein n=1 Tax=Methanomicrobium antiquum TaxID=487686 RepID=UPI002415C6CE|nr:PKD domain-containing protein [Methanomicrobium antiquum]